MTNTLSLAPYSYLVIDDDDFSLKCISALLGKLHARHIISKPDGLEAAMGMESPEGRPDIILCDLNMPEMDGVEFIQLLAKIEFTGGLILISGASQGLLDIAMNLAQARSLNVLGTLTKPIMFDKLAELIARYEAT